MRAAAVQLNCTDDKQRNLAEAERHVRAAAAEGARLIALPERLNVRGTHEDYAREAEPLDGPTSDWASKLASELGVDLVAGSIVEDRAGADKPLNTSVHFGPDGEPRGVYRKIHLFDVTVGDVDYRESVSNAAGDEIVLSELADGTSLGLTVCYDVRFPELFRILALRGALVVTVPANFTRITGEAHWEVLLRARAIEDQVFVVAPAQTGEYPPGNPSYGHSMIVDPWGTVLARAGEEEGFVAADLDLARLADVRERIPSLANRVPAAYRWPVEAPA